MPFTYRYCPQCAHPLEERLVSGRVRPACPACEYVHYRDAKVGAGVLVTRGDELLLLLRPRHDVFGPGTWGLPAGFLEFDESPREAAAREAAEETGLQVKIGRLFGVYFYTDDPRGNGVFIAFQATALDGELHPQADEVAAARWFPLDALPENLSGGGHGQAIKEWRERQ